MKRSEQEIAGLKLLAFAVKRNVDRVERRYRNKATREACQQLAALADGIIECAETGVAFSVFIGRQLSLPDNEAEEEVRYVAIADEESAGNKLGFNSWDEWADWQERNRDYITTDLLYGQID